MEFSITEENYLKAFYYLMEDLGSSEARVQQLSEYLSVKPSSVHDMLKKLKEKELVEYEKYGKVSLTAQGLQVAMQIVRKHRLWETFLCEKLGFSWDEVHDLAEQLEHIQSHDLIDRLEAFLGYPQFDPHGDPIPNASGEILHNHTLTLAQASPQNTYKIVGIKNKSPHFLQHIQKIGLTLNQSFYLIEKQDFDLIFKLEIHGKQVVISDKLASNLFVEEVRGTP